MLTVHKQLSCYRFLLNRQLGPATPASVAREFISVLEQTYGIFTGRADTAVMAQSSDGLPACMPAQEDDSRGATFS